MRVWCFHYSPTRSGTVSLRVDDVVAAMYNETSGTYILNRSNDRRIEIKPGWAFCTTENDHATPRRTVDSDLPREEVPPS